MLSRLDFTKVSLLYCSKFWFEKGLCAVLIGNQVALSSLPAKMSGDVKCPGMGGHCLTGNCFAEQVEAWKHCTIHWHWDGMLASALSHLLLLSNACCAWVYLHPSFVMWEVKCCPYGLVMFLLFWRLAVGGQVVYIFRVCLWRFNP